MIALRFPRDVPETAFEQLLLAGHGWLGGGGVWGAPPRLTFEFTQTGAGVTVAALVSEPRLADRLGPVLTAALPGLECTADDCPVPAGLYLVRVSLGGNVGSLRTTLPRPGLAAVLAPLAGAPAGTAVQLVLTARPEQTRRLLTRAQHLERGGRSRGLEALLGTQASRPQARALREKASAPLYAATLSIAAPTATAARELAAAISQAGAVYAPVRTHAAWPQWLVRWQMRTRRHAWLPLPRLVSCTELGALLTTSPEGLRQLGIATARTRRLSAPPGAVRKGRVIGVDPSGQRVSLDRENARYHLALLGPTGTGKSTLMATQILAAAEAGDGVVVVDPKGDLIEDVLCRLPERRTRDVIVIDPVGEREHPVGLNLLAPGPGQSPAAVADGLLAALRDLHARNWGARLDDTLYNALLTAASRPGATIAELPNLYASPRQRAAYLGSLDDPFVRSFWEGFDRVSPAERAAIVAPVLNKLRPLLRPELAPIVAQPRSTVDLDQVLAHRQILLVHIPRGAELFGTLLVARLWQAILRRTSQPASKRPDVLLAIDEVQSFLRTGGDTAEMLAVARGLHVGLCVATQHLDQCPPALRAALLANARSRVVFQSDAEDARVLARGFAPDLEAEDLTGLGRYEVAVRLAIDGAVSRPFTARTLPLPEPLRSSSQAIRAASRSRYGRPRREVLEEIAARVAPDDLTDATIGTTGIEDA